MTRRKLPGFLIIFMLLLRNMHNAHKTMLQTDEFNNSRRRLIIETSLWHLLSHFNPLSLLIVVNQTCKYLISFHFPHPAYLQVSA